MLAEGAKKLFQDMAAFEFDLLQLGRAENEIESDLLVELTFGFDGGVDGQVEGVPVGAVTQKAGARGEAAAVHESTDAGAEVGFVAVLANDLAQLLEQRALFGAQLLAGGPFSEAADVDVAGVDAIDDVVERIGGVVGPVHHLALDAFERVQGLGAGQSFGERGAVEDGITPVFLLVVDEVVLRIME